MFVNFRLPKGVVLSGILLLSGITAHAGSPGDLVGKWDLKTIQGEPVLDEGPTMLEFNEEGRVAARAGCNNIMSSYELSADGIRFGQGASTMMACPQPQMDQEQGFIKAMEAARGYALDGDTVRFNDGDGNALFSASRME